MWTHQIHCPTPKIKAIVVSYLNSLGYEGGNYFPKDLEVIVIDTERKLFGANDLEAAKRTNIFGPLVDFNTLFSKDFGLPKSIEVKLNNEYLAVVSKEHIILKSYFSPSASTCLPITIIDDLVSARDRIIKN